MKRIISKRKGSGTDTKVHAGPPAKKSVRQYMARENRQALVLAKAADYFAEHGLTAQTRAIAQVCGVSQRLLYQLFPNKAALITAVYEQEIPGAFDAMWFVSLKDRSVPLETRLITFYRHLYESTLTRRRLRLLMFSSLSGLDRASTDAGAIARQLNEIVVNEIAHDTGRDVPNDVDQLAEIGWMMHGAVSHLAYRRQIYGLGTSIPAEEVIATYVRGFLSGIPALLPQLQSR